MLISSKKLLEQAKEKNEAIFQFNINNLEFTRFILEQANIMNKNIILGVSEGAINYMGGYNVVVNMVKSLINDLNIKIDVVLHLDHGRTIECCEKAIKAGFTSVMYDGSKLPIEENIKNTKYLKEKYKDIPLEGELGAIGTKTNVISYTNLEDAIRYVNETNVDSLAVAVGNVHGVYKGKPKINIELIKEISEKTSVPLVLHGGSGISDDVFKDSIRSGICKININTQIQIVWAKKVRKYLLKNREEHDPRNIIKSGEQSVKKLVEDYLSIAL